MEKEDREGETRRERQVKEEERKMMTRMRDGDKNRKKEEERQITKGRDSEEDKEKKERREM